MAIADIPQELIDYTISFLQDDRETLRSSSLVCRSWRPDSQRALFRTLQLYLTNKSIADVISFFSGPEDEVDDLQTIPQRHVRDLTISSGVYSSKTASKVTMQDLLSLLLLLPALQSLTLQGLSLEYDHESLTPRRLPLDCLALKSVFGIGTRHGLISALLSLCCPRSLHLTQLNFDTTSPQVTWPVPHLAEITSLTLRSRWSIVPFLELFKTGALEELRVSCYVTSDVQALGNFLVEAGHQLKRFSVDLTDFIMRTPNPSEDDIRRLHLNHIPSLTDLTIRFSFLAEPWASLPFNSTMFRTASQIITSAPPSLRTLSFSIMLDGHAITEDAYLRPFAQRVDADLPWLCEFDKERPTLRSLVWKWRGMGRQSNWRYEQREQLKTGLAKVLKERFEALDANGILQIQKAEDDS